MLGDKIGIFPLLYVEVSHALRRTSSSTLLSVSPGGWGVGVETLPRTPFPREENGDCVGVLFKLLCQCFENCLGPSGCVSQTWLQTHCVGREGGLGCRLAPFLTETLCWHPLTPDFPTYCRSGLPSLRGEDSISHVTANAAEECWLWRAVCGPHRTCVAGQVVQLRALKAEMICGLLISCLLSVTKEHSVSSE